MFLGMFKILKSALFQLEFAELHSDIYKYASKWASKQAEVLFQQEEILILLYTLRIVK